MCTVSSHVGHPSSLNFCDWPLRVLDTRLFQFKHGGCPEGFQETFMIPMVCILFWQASLCFHLVYELLLGWLIVYWITKDFYLIAWVYYWGSRVCNTVIIMFLPCHISTQHLKMTFFFHPLLPNNNDSCPKSCFCYKGGWGLLGSELISPLIKQWDILSLHLRREFERKSDIVVLDIQ